MEELKGGVTVPLYNEKGRIYDRVNCEEIKLTQRVIKTTKDYTLEKEAMLGKYGFMPSRRDTVNAIFPLRLVMEKQRQVHVLLIGLKEAYDVGPGDWMMYDKVGGSNGRAVLFSICTREQKQTVCSMVIMYCGFQHRQENRI